MYQFDWSILWGEGGRLLLQGAAVTLELSAFSLVLALMLGFLFGMLRWSDIKWLRPVCWFYVEFLRNTPPLVQILFWYFSATVILPAGAIAAVRDWGFQFVAAVFGFVVSVAVFALGLCSDATPAEAAELANRASGVVVAKLGTATATPAEVQAEL